MKKIKEILCILLSIFAIFTIALQINKTKAATIGDVNYLERSNKGFYSIQKWNGTQWIYVTYSITHYTDQDGVKRVAYCVDPSLKGVGWISGEFAGYDVKMKELLSDQRLWRVYTNGYPYKTPSELGVETEDDAYLATKMASYCILYSHSIEDIRNLYRPGADKVAGQNLEDIQRRGQKVIDAMCCLVDKGYNGTETMQHNNILQINKQGELSKDTTNENYYSVICNVTSKVECSSYKVSEISGFPEGTYIANKEGKAQTVLEGNQSFKLMVPKESITQSVTGTINITGKCKNYPIYYAECTTGNYQNYALCCDAYSNDIQAIGTININANKSGIEITKIDKDTKDPISGVKFSIKYDDGTDLGIHKTNEKGKINIQNIKPGNIQITEIEANENYKLNSKTTNLTLKYNEIKKITLENEKKKGAIKIIKVDADNNEIKIQGAKFEIYNEKNKLVGSITTDKNGEAKLEKLPINAKYTIKEVETAKDYILTDEIVTIQLKENEIKTITFKNKKKEIKEEIKEEDIEETDEKEIDEEQIEEEIEEEEFEEEEQEQENEVEKEIEKLPRTGLIDISNYLIGVSIAGIVINTRILTKKK
ncbi:MAG: Cys-Gln thioester bond-forming surface protein [Clostridia bacterium]|nr:Cys-Gln thioester bond-forming surface protein [Clostridia bacterium]